MKLSVMELSMMILSTRALCKMTLFISVKAGFDEYRT